MTTDHQPQGCLCIWLSDKQIVIQGRSEDTERREVDLVEPTTWQTRPTPTEDLWWYENALPWTMCRMLDRPREGTRTPVRHKATGGLTEMATFEPGLKGGARLLQKW